MKLFWNEKKKKFLKLNYEDPARTNLRATTSATSYFIKTKVNIINISSVSGYKEKNPLFTAYGLTTAGLNFFTSSAATLLQNQLLMVLESMLSVNQYQSSQSGPMYVMYDIQDSVKEDQVSLNLLNIKQH